MPPEQVANQMASEFRGSILQRSAHAQSCACAEWFMGLEPVLGLGVGLVLGLGTDLVLGLGVGLGLTMGAAVLILHRM